MSVCEYISQTGLFFFSRDLFLQLVPNFTECTRIRFTHDYTHPPGNIPCLRTMPRLITLWLERELRPSFLKSA